MYWLSVEKVILSINEGILYLIKGCAHRTFNKNLATKHYSQNCRFWVRGRGKIIPTISTVSFFIPTVKFPRLRCIQIVRSQPKTLPVSFIVDVRKAIVYRNLIFELKTFNLNNWVIKWSQNKIQSQLNLNQNLLHLGQE